MLTALTLALTSLLLPPQDGPSAGTAAPQASPARDLMRAAAARIYRPEERGLVSLGFVISIEQSREQLAMLAAQRGMAAGDLADVVRLADVSVQWTEGAEPVVSSRVDEALPPAIADMREQFELALPQMGHQMLTACLGRVVDLNRLLQHYDASLVGVEGGVSEVLLERKAGASEADAPAAQARWFFDAEGLPARSVLQVEQPTPRGPLTISMTSRHAWRPSGDADGSVLLERVTVEMDMGYMGRKINTATYHYERVAGFQIVVGSTETASQSMPQGELPTTENTTWLEDLRVNGAARGG